MTFLKSAFGPSVWIQFHIDIDFTKQGRSQDFFRPPYPHFPASRKKLP